MRRENRKVNSVGWAGCVGLLLLAFLLVNPVVGSLAFAEEDEVIGDSDVGSQIDNNYSDDSSDMVATTTDDSIMTLADTNTSIVGISFSPARYYASLSPTSAGQSAKIDITATVNVYNSGGYSVYLKSNDTRLVGVSNSANTIAGATTAKTYANMDVNTWGYASAVGTEVPVNATYKAVAVSGNGDELAKNNTGSNIESDTKTIALSFATKMNDTIKADTYSNTMTLSVVSSPWKVVIAEDFGIGTMQEMTPSICSSASDKDGNGEISGQLKDVRDGKYYWVTKLADDNCWMTQNLDLDLNANTTPLKAATSDVGVDGWVPKNDASNTTYTANVASSSTICGSYTGQCSWSLGDYYIKYPDDGTGCGSNIGDTGTALSACKASKTTGTPNMFAALKTPISADDNGNAHYILGNYYQWNTATAGSGGTILTGQAADSICSRGWKLPTTGNLGTLVSKGSISSSVTKLVSAPYYFVRGGYVYPSTSGLFTGAGGNGMYWTSMPYQNSQGERKQAYYLSFGGTNSISTANYSNNNRNYGASVRCIAR